MSLLGDLYIILNVLSFIRLLAIVLELASSLSLHPADDPADGLSGGSRSPDKSASNSVGFCSSSCSPVANPSSIPDGG